LFSYKNKFNFLNQLAYNNFADKRCIFCIRNFGDVVSNIVFIIGGLYHYNSHFELCILSFLVAIGSTYYHWNPNMMTLYFDRLPMVLLLNYLIYWKFSIGLLAANLIGLYTLLYWHYTYDLIPYTLYQTVPVILFVFDTTLNMQYYGIFYILAKLCENNDIKIYLMTNKIISGHTIKHILAGLALLYIT